MLKSIINTIRNENLTLLIIILVGSIITGIGAIGFLHWECYEDWGLNPDSIWRKLLFVASITLILVGSWGLIILFTY